MPEYKPNSYKYREEQAKKEAEEKKEISVVVSGGAKTKKKSQTRKLADSILAEDATNVGSYILTDVLIPSFKKLVGDIVRDGIEMLLWGGTKSGGGRSGGSRPDYVPYNRYSDRRDDSYRDNRSRVKSLYNYDEVVVETKGDAEEVLTTMEELIDRYGFVSVAELYEMVRLPSAHTDCKYGWESLRTAKTVRVRDGYLLDLPRPRPLD